MSEIERESSRLHKLMISHPAIFRNEQPAVVSWVPPGWYAIVDNLCSAIELALGENVQAFAVDQVKEKFASLRFYYTLSLPDPPGEPLPARVVEHAGGIRISKRSSHPLKQAVDQLVEKAETLSLATCQWCGSNQGVDQVVGGKAQHPRYPGRNDIGAGLVHTACAECRGDAISPEKWRQRMEQRRQQIEQARDKAKGSDDAN